MRIKSLVVLLMFFLVHSSTYAQTEQEVSQELVERPSRLHQDNTFVDQEYGVKITFPSGWFIKDGRPERKAKADKMKGKLQGIIDIGLAFFPLVTAYKLNPDSVDPWSNPHIKFRVKKHGKNPFKSAKEIWQFVISMSAGKYLVPPYETTVNGMKALRVEYQYEEPDFGGTLNNSNCIFLLEDNTQYIFELSSPPEKVSQVKSDFEKIITSLELLP